MFLKVRLIKFLPVCLILQFSELANDSLETSNIF